MENTDLEKTLEEFEKLSSYSEISNKLKTYSVDTLELFAGKLYKDCCRKGLRRSDLLNIILSERFRKIDIDFQWTDENKDKILQLNNKITQVFEKAYNEAVSAANELENRINNNDDFLKDYEIDISISFYMEEKFYEDDANENFAYVLSEPLSDYQPINHSFGHSSFLIEKQEKPILLDTTYNYNFEYFGDAFKDQYIGYALHVLLYYDWSFKDLINIKSMWANVEVTLQHYVEGL